MEEIAICLEIIFIGHISNCLNEIDFELHFVG